MTSASAIWFGFSYKTAHYYSLYLLGALKECWCRPCLCYRKLVEKWNLRSIKLSKKKKKKPHNYIYLKKRNFSKSCFDLIELLLWHDHLIILGERIEKIFYLKIVYICVSVYTHIHTHTHICENIGNIILV